MPSVYAKQTAPDLPRVGLPHDNAQFWFVGLVGAAIAAITLYVTDLISWQTGQNFLMGCLLGYVLYRATFGFTGPWRNFIVHGRGLGMRKTLAMLGAASIVIMTLGALGGYPTVVHPVGWALLIGAFVFGIGMQWGGCCGSGTAYVAGGGSARVMVTLIFFCVGSVWGTIDAPWWWGWSKFGRVSLVEQTGLAGGIIVTLAVLAALALVTVWVERARHGKLQTFESNADTPINKLIYGPWSPMTGGVLMGVLTGLVLVVTHQPWGITFGYTLYGAKALTALGVDLAAFTAPGSDTAFWGMGWAQKALEEPFWRNNAANMNIGIILGAALAAGLVGKWRPTLKGVPWQSVLAAALGGILMGYGARISTGCNIGAMVNGIASGSVHGWAWMAAAFAGNFLAVWTRPWFKMEN